MRKINIFILISIKIIQLNCFTEEITDCDIWSKEHIYEHKEPQFFNDTLTFVHFENFSELKITCRNASFNVKKHLNIFTENPFLLENNFHLKNFFSNFLFPKNFSKTVIFYNLKGFNYNSQTSLMTLREYFFYLYVSKFQFYLKGEEISLKLCERKNFLRSMNFFGMISNLFVYSDALYTEVCPYVFMDTKLNSLNLYQISNSLIFQNHLRFMNINETLIFDMNSRSLFYLNLNVIYYEITTDLLNKFVFRYIQKLYLTGIIYGIQSDLFDFFKDVSFVFIRDDDFEAFFHSGTQWLTGLNRNLKVDLSNKLEFKLNTKNIILLQFYDEESFFSKSYEYPDSDICLFKDFPHQSMVYPSILPAKKLICSCTILWLIQFSRLYLNSDYSAYNYNLQIEYTYSFENNTVRNCIYQKDFQTLVKSCNFERMFNFCDINQDLKKSDTFRLSGNLNMYFNFKWFQYISEVYIQSVLSFFGILANIITILVIKNKKKTKMFKFTFYKHLCMNSGFNVFYCFIHLISLMNVCIFIKGSFCSQVFKSNFNQYFKIYVVYLFGDCFKLCSNVSYMILSITRFYESTSSSKSSKFFNKILKLNMRHFYLICFLVGLLLNSFQIFQYRANSFFNPISGNFPFDAFDIKYCQFSNSSKLFDFECKIFPILYLINSILNNIVFIILNFIIDISLIRFAKKSYIEKTHVVTEKSSLEEVRKMKDKITKMVIINNLVLFISHIPEFLTTIFMMIFREKIKKFCFHMFSCKKIIEMSQVFCLISISFQIFIFISFDKNFKQSLIDLFKRKFSRQKN